VGDEILNSGATAQEFSRRREFESEGEDGKAVLRTRGCAVCTLRFFGDPGRIASE